MDSCDHILVVDDDDRLRALLQRFLRDNGFVVSVAASAQAARQLMQSIAFDAMVLDIMMPGETGLSFIESLRRSSDMPVLLISAKGEADDRIGGLELGADDYLSKPFDPRELVARLRSILRRQTGPAQATDVAPANSITFGRFRFDMDRAELHEGEALVRLAPGESQLLMQLAKASGEAVAREELGDGSGDVTTRSIDVQIARLRRKIEENPRFPRYLQTIRGVGYVLLSD